MQVSYSQAQCQRQLWTVGRKRHFWCSCIQVSDQAHTSFLCVDCTQTHTDLRSCVDDCTHTLPQTPIIKDKGDKWVKRNAGNCAGPDWKMRVQVKNLASVLKRCVYDVRSSKDNLAQLQVSLRSYSQNMFIGVLLSNLHFACHLQEAICGTKKIHLVCLSFELLGLQMATIAQNDQNYLRLLNVWIKRFLN